MAKTFTKLTRPTIRKTNPASLSHDDDHNLKVRQSGKKEAKVSADNCDASHDDKGGETNAEAHQKIAAMTRAKKVMGKYLENSINVCNESWLVNRVRTICCMTETPMKAHTIKFEISEEAAQHNTTMLRKSNNDYGKLLANNKGTILTPGSKFRSVDHLSLIWKYRKDWKLIEQILLFGCDYPTKDAPTKQDHHEDIKVMILRGNHTSAKDVENVSALHTNYAKEVKKGWMIPILVSALK